MISNIQNKNHQIKALPWERFVFFLLALIVYRVGAHIPVPGINTDELSILFGKADGSILGMFNMFSGGALSRLSIFALGIMPYISASIIMQLLGMVWTPIESLKKEGETGRRKISQYTRFSTLLLSTVQAVGIGFALESQRNLVLDPGLFFKFVTVVSLVTGSMFLMWLGEQITERGVGNGISIIIFAGIAAGLPSGVASFFELVRTGSVGSFSALIISFLVFFVTFFVVFVERGQRKILINYAKRQVGLKTFANQSSHLPLKINMAGVIPPIFASSIILFPATLSTWFAGNESFSQISFYLKSFSSALSPGEVLHVVLYSLGIVFFCFFYAALVFNSRETSDNLKKSGAFIPGIRPGDQTSKYLDKILLRLTLVGSLYMVLVCLLPEILISKWSLPFYFGGTSLLIIVVVAMDFMAQIQNYAIAQRYDSLLRKSKFKAF